MGTKQKSSFSKVERHKGNSDKFLKGTDNLQMILKLRSRIQKILDEQFTYLSQKLQKQLHLKNYMKRQIPDTNEILINEPKLQQWVEMFRNQILLIKPKQTLQNQYPFHQNSQIQMPSLQFVRPLVQKDDQKVLWHIDGNKLNFFQLKSEQLHNRLYEYKFPQKQLWRQNLYEFEGGMLKKHSTVTYLPDSNELIIIGGSKLTNPNIKSSKILSLSLKTTKMQRLLNLPYGLSSHSAVFHKKLNSIYIIGGNKNHSIVTRGCFRLDLTEMIVEQISCLNYPVSSATCITWREKWIYKFGGVGDAFGQWSTSPYIERYSISQNEWEVINPQIRKTTNPEIVFHNLFLANSSSYICEEEDKIFVFGGYSSRGEFKNYGYVLKIEQRLQDGQNQDLHSIQQYGAVSCGNFKSLSQIVFCENQAHKKFMFGLGHCVSDEQVSPHLIKTHNY